MQEELTAYTKSDYETMRELYRYRSREFQIAAGLAGALLSAAAFQGVFREHWPNIAVLLPYIVAVLLIGALFAGIIYSGYSRRTHARSADTIAVGWTFKFGADHITVLPDSGSPTDIRYQDVVRAAETKNLILLYQSRLASLPVDKRGIRGGTPDELRALLRERLPAGTCKFS